ncbi:MAG: abortive infection protein [Candidatus Magnetoglobus multicellularis str. Araruama]|uniref:Abortive infection protein n=1 Tax=Candidatus Magnetoglobus multicellularis str. Araruama TaxID=890399 RepID=A0A1V1PFT0_9BACT|nr:MAG: abortive infection protein [Candidatus Magnetoglobus multicellularis str. Araruama]
MIKYFAVENFRSIMKESILELDSGAKGNTLYMNPIIGFAGANASGKTTILEALTFVLWFMKYSFLNIKENIPIFPFAATPDLPTKFHIIFSKQSKIDDPLKSIDYEYELVLSKKQVLYESLYYQTDKQKKMAYIRDNDNLEFGNTIPIPASDINIFSKDLRHNSSIISYAAMFPSQEIAIACQNYQFHSNLGLTGFKKFEFNELDLQDLLNNKVLFDNVLKFIQISDIGIDNIMFTDVTDILFEHHIGGKK